MEEMGRRAAGDLSSYTGHDRSASEIVGDIVANAQEIVRAEIRLAKAEAREEGRKALEASVASGVGAGLGLYGLGFLLASATAALALVMAWWLAALIVGAVLVVCGGIGLAAGKARWQRVHAPDKVVADVRENVEWLKNQTRS